MACHHASRTTYNNYIDGQWLPSASGETFENRNPANTDDLIGIFQKSKRQGRRGGARRRGARLRDLAAGAGAEARRDALSRRRRSSPSARSSSRAT